MEENIKVEVYWNLHKNIFSVRHKGKVIAHVNEITLKDVEFKVSQAGRERVLREKRKNVHAFVRGYVTRDFVNAYVPVTYNPYRYSSFVERGKEKPVLNARGAFLTVVFDRPVMLKSAA